MTDLHEKDVERYDVFYDGSMFRRSDGDWVRHEDYAARLAEVERERDARVAAAFEEAAAAGRRAANQINRAGLVVRENNPSISGAAHVQNTIRALALPEETDALDRIRAEERERLIKIVREGIDHDTIGTSYDRELAMQMLETALAHTTPERKT